MAKALSEEQVHQRLWLALDNFTTQIGILKDSTGYRAWHTHLKVALTAANVLQLYLKDQPPLEFADATIQPVVNRIVTAFILGRIHVDIHTDFEDITTCHELYKKLEELMNRKGFISDQAEFLSWLNCSRSRYPSLSKYSRDYERLFLRANVLGFNISNKAAVARWLAEVEPDVGHFVLQCQSQFKGGKENADTITDLHTLILKAEDLERGQGIRASSSLAATQGFHQNNYSSGVEATAIKTTADVAAMVTPTATKLPGSFTSFANGGTRASATSNIHIYARKAG